MDETKKCEKEQKLLKLRNFLKDFEVPEKNIIST